MNEIEPTTSGTGGLNRYFEGELSVEQVAEIVDFDAAPPTGAQPAAGEPAAAGVLEEMEVPLADPSAVESLQAVPAGAMDVAPTGFGPFPWPFWRRQKVSGRYKSSGDVFFLVLRVDVDRNRPMRRVSGDYFRKSGGTVHYFGSFVVNRPRISVTFSKVTISGLGRYTFQAGAPRVQVTIPRVPTWQSPAPATLQHATLDGVPGASYLCAFESRHFRTVEIEEDSELGVTAFASYDTGSLSSGGSARTLDIGAAYAEAGVEMLTAGVSNVVPTAPGGTWSDAELHAAMLNHFSLWKDDPQWKVWLLHAVRHDYGLGLLGIMFDQIGKQRQGCAVFYAGSLGGTSAASTRSQLYTCVHELGHCFNLFHSFHKVYMDPPMPNRLDALSWMNYPQNFPSGAAAFWNAFPFQFDDLELIHLRHAFRDNIIMGGDPFGTGAALEERAAFADPVEDRSGLRLVLEAPPSFATGEPVVVEIKLYTNDLSGKRVHKHLHPNYGFVQLAVQRPDGRVIVHEPPIDHCVQVETITLDADLPAIYESAYVGHDKAVGPIFNNPGTYTIRALYYALDGSTVLSNVLKLRVRPPLTAADEKVADLLIGDQQGMLFYLLGSDSEFLKGGDRALDTVLQEHAEHPLAVYARLVKGINDAREFKTLTPDYQVVVREPRVEQAVDFLSSVVEASEAGVGVDNITLNMAMQRMARTQAQAGDTKGARATITQMGSIFRKKGLRGHVQDVIKQQQAALRAEL